MVACNLCVNALFLLFKFALCKCLMTLIKPTGQKAFYNDFSSEPRHPAKEICSGALYATSKVSDWGPLLRVSPFPLIHILSINIKIVIVGVE